MRSERDRPRWGPLSWKPRGPREGQAPHGEQTAKPDPETQLDEGVAARVALQRERLRLENEIERLRQIEAQFEAKYHASLDEFQVRYRPGEDPQADTDYMQWAHLTEQLRYAQAALTQLAQRRAPAPPPEQESET